LYFSKTFAVTIEHGDLFYIGIGIPTMPALEIDTDLILSGHGLVNK